MNDNKRTCFVCNLILTKTFNLVTCRTTTNHKRIVNKLGQLVGENYMVIVKEDDKICQSCCNIIDKLDCLETELASVRSNILRLLEKKYSLDSGALNYDKNTSTEKLSNDSSVSFAERKKISENANCKELNKSDDNSSDSDEVWMKCDTCSYTTNYSTFVNRHMPDQDIQIKPTDEAVIMDIFSALEPPDPLELNNPPVNNTSRGKMQPQQRLYVTEMNGMRQIITLTDPKDISAVESGDYNILVAAAMNPLPKPGKQIVGKKRNH